MPTLATFPAGALLGPDFPLPVDEPFTLQQALAHRVSVKMLRRLHARGFVRRLLKGVYVAAQAPDGLMLRARALALVVPKDSVVVDWTAVWLYTGMLPPNGHLSVPPVTLFRHAGRGRLRNDLCRSGERTFIPDDIQVVAGLQVTTPVRTTWDIGRFAHPDSAIGAMDALMRTGLVDRDEMLKGVRRFRRQRWVTRLRLLAPQVDPRSESPGESLLRLRWLVTPGMPPPQPQVPIFDDNGREVFRLDMGDPVLRYAAEYDGEEHHSTAADREHDRARRSWIRDCRGWVIDVFERDDLTTESNPRTELRLLDGIERARRNLSKCTATESRAGRADSTLLRGQDAPTRPGREGS
jgi:hypothetical protein